MPEWKKAITLLAIVLLGVPTIIIAMALYANWIHALFMFLGLSDKGALFLTPFATIITGAAVAMIFIVRWVEGHWIGFKSDE